MRTNMGIEIGTVFDTERIKHGLSACELVIDALLGTGESGGPKHPILEIISVINESGKFVFWLIAHKNINGFGQYLSIAASSSSLQ